MKGTSMMKGLADRRLDCVKVAASQLKRMHRKGEPPSADDLIDYAEQLHEWTYTGRRLHERSEG